MIDLVQNLVPPENFGNFPFKIPFDEPVAVVQDLFDTMAVVGVVTRRVWREDNEETVRQMMEAEMVATKQPITLEVEVTRLCVIFVELEFDGEIITKHFYCPKILDDNTCMINDVSRYFIYQMVEDRGYATQNAKGQCAVVKTMTMPYTLMVVEETIRVPNESADFAVRAIYANAFKRQIPITTYLLNIWSLEELAEYFGLSGHIEVFDATHANPPSCDDWVVIVIEQIGFRISRNLLVNGPQPVKDFIGTLMSDVRTNPMTHKQFFQRSEWTCRLGSHFSTNPNVYERRGRNILMSFERIMDNRTRRYMVDVPDEWKSSTGFFTMWLALNIDSWLQIDSTHMGSKRIRRLELLVYGLFERMSRAVEQIISKNCNKRTIYAVLNKSLKSDEIMRFLSKVDTLRYADYVNFTIFPHLQVTKKGAFAMGSKNTNIATEHMYYTRSMMGILSPTATSAETGITVTLIPTVGVDDLGRFKVRPDYESILPEE